MKLAFAHDTWFLRGDDGQVWTDRGSFPWDRYLEFADSITVVSRMRDLAPGESTDRMALVSRPEVSFVPLPNLATPLGRVARRRAARRALRDVLAGADGLIARLPSEIGGLACRVADDLGVMWAVELVTCPWDAIWNYGNWKGRVFAPIAWRETRGLLRRAPFALYVTEQFLQRRYPARHVSVGVSDVEIDLPGASVLEQRLERIDRAEAADTPLVLGTIAALIPFKGLDTAFAALASVPRATLRILGAGDVDRYRAMAATAGVGDRVVFDGTLPGGEPVRQWLDSIDVYIQPSRQEGLPRGMVEAMSRGCPVVGSTAGGIPELLDADCLHPPGDAAALARLLARASDPAWRREQAQRNVEVAARYEPGALDERRRAFWRTFAEAASGRAGEPRVLFVTPYAQLGGSERQLLRLLGALPPEQVAGVVSLQEGSLLARLDRPPIVLPTGPGAIDVARAARAVREVITKTRPDVVHASCAKGALVAGLAALGTGVPVLFVKHDFTWDGPVAWLAASMCKQVVASSEALNATFPKPLRPRLHVVYPGVPAEPGDREDGRLRVHRLTGADQVVGMVGRFHPDKGQLDAVVAMEDVPDAHLLLIGGVDETTPHYRDEVAARAGERVTMAGEQEDVVDLLAGCDVVVVPSLVREGFGLVPVEAFRAGTPVVAYGHGALPEVIGDCGVLVPPGDTAALAAAVKALLGDADERARLVECGRPRSERFTVEALAAGMRARYRAATSNVN